MASAGSTTFVVSSGYFPAGSTAPSIGLRIIFTLKGNSVEEKTCPQCAAKVRKEAIVCNYCSYYFTSAAMAAQKKGEWDWIKARLFGCLGLLVLIIAGGYLVYHGFRSEEPKSTPRRTITSSAAQRGPTPKPESSEVRKTTEPAPAPTERQLSPQMEAYGEMIATAINLNGLLCARVVDVRPLTLSKDVFEVTCIEYRGGTGRKTYILNSETGVAFEQ